MKTDQRYDLQSIARKCGAHIHMWFRHMSHGKQYVYVQRRLGALFGLLLHVLGMGKAGAAGLYAPDPFPYGDNYAQGATTDIGSVLKQGNQGGSLLENLLDLFDINYAGDNKAILFGQVVINYVLAILGTIALIVVIYAFAMIFTGKEEEQFKKAKKTLLWAGVAIVLVGFSAYIVNFAFYVYVKGL